MSAYSPHAVAAAAFAALTQRSSPVATAQEAWMVVSQEVEDFDRWKDVFEQARRLRRSAGETAFYILQNPVHSNLVKVWFEWDTQERARAWPSPPNCRAGKTWDEATIKDLTGGDRLTARYMRQDFFEFTPQLTLMIAGNTQPSFRGVDEAIRSRVVPVPFCVTIPPEKRDKALPDKLRAEAPAILRRYIDGALAWQERGLDVPPAIAAALETCFGEEDTDGQFPDDETVADPHAIALTDDLIERFNFWSDRQGLGRWTKQTLVKELKLRGFSDAKSNGRRGLGMK
jgi:hypothetical protein